MFSAAEPNDKFLTLQKFGSVEIIWRMHRLGSTATRDDFR
jgi:hypothetical protein